MPRARVSRLSWVRFFPEDFLGGVQQMDCREVGQYILALCAQWCAERGAERTGLRPAEGALKAVLRGEQMTEAVRAKFGEISLPSGRFLRNERMSNEIKHSEEEHASRSRGAERTAERTTERPAERTQTTTRTRTTTRKRTTTEKKNIPPPAAEPDGSVALTTRETWLTPYGAAWMERWGSESKPPYGEMAKEFGPSEEKLGPEELCSRWVRFLAAAHTSQWARPVRFVQGLGEWAEKSALVAIPKPTPKEQKRRDVLRASMLGGLRGDGTLGGGND